MAKPVWVQKLQIRIEAKPLFFTKEGGILCKDCGGEGKKVPLYRITNYGESYSKCDKCGFVHR